MHTYTHTHMHFLKSVSDLACVMAGPGEWRMRTLETEVTRVARIFKSGFTFKIMWPECVHNEVAASC